MLKRNFFVGDDFAIIQQEIIMMKDCKHENIVAYFGSYLRLVLFTCFVKYMTLMQTNDHDVLC